MLTSAIERFTLWALYGAPHGGPGIDSRHDQFGNFLELFENRIGTHNAENSLVFTRLLIGVVVWQIYF